LGRALVTNPKVAKAAFTGSTATGRLVMQYATENIIPVTLELGGNPQRFLQFSDGCR
jgi:aldehyde dehydrogenase